MNSTPLPPAALLALVALAAALPLRAEPLYRSAFESARPHADPKPVEWRTANEQVGALGGHAGHLRASKAEPGPEAPAGPAGQASAHGEHGPRHGPMHGEPRSDGGAR